MDANFFSYFKNVPSFIFKIVLCFFTLNAFVNASDPRLDQQGDLIPSPTGNFTYVRIPEAMSAEKGQYTWTYMGTLLNAADRQPLSFEGVLFQVNNSDADSSGVVTGVGLHTFQLGFKDDGDFFYVNSTYGGEDHIAQALAQSLDTIKSKASLDNYFVSAAPLITGGQIPTWRFESLSSSPIAPLYKGLIGQPGHTYQFTATGTTFLWHYSADGHATIQNYRYKFSLDLLDERGAIPEGFGGSYIGPALVSSTKTDTVKSANAEYAVSQPRLRAVNWTIQLQAINDKLPVGFKTNYVFSGNDGMLWADTGTLAPEPIQEAFNQLPQLLNHYQPKLSLPFLAAKPVKNLSEAKSLYNGNWIVMQLTQGKYKGASMVFVPFWNKLPTDPSSNPNTDDSSWCIDGYANLYTGILDNDVASAYTIPEVLIPGNPAPNANPPAHWSNPFTLRFLKMADSQKYGLLFPWVQQLEITINPYSQIRYALAAYAHRMNPMVNDDVSQPIHIMVTAISPVTQNIVFSKQVTQMYEGAASVTIDDKVVGSSWVEEMIGNS